MPSFFEFTQGPDAAARYQPDSAPLLGRFRAVPPRQPEPPFRRAQLGLLASADQHPGARRGRFGHSRNGSTNSVGDFGPRDMQQIAQENSGALAGYGAIIIPDLRASDASDSDDDDGTDAAHNPVFGAVESTKPMRSAAAHVARALRKCRRKIANLYVQPRQSTIKRVINMWYSRYFVMVVVPALLTISWCAIPFPKYEIPWDEDGPDQENEGLVSVALRHIIGVLLPGHGAARVEVNFWFFLFVYYGLYNLVALMWITKVFNIYNLNWWPKSLGFPLTFSLIAVTGTSAPIVTFYRPEMEFLTRHNTAWISWTFVIMAMPVMIAFLILTFNERHLGLRKSLSETQRIFTSSWWTSETDTLSRHDANNHRRRMLQPDSFDDPDLQVSDSSRHRQRYRARGQGTVAMRRSWLPASFVRFIWFCLALTVGLSAYLLGEAYAEIYLRTLPHNSWETIMYVYSWVITVHLLDMLTGWILGVREGERVGSYPLSWIFKLYYMITYQTYVRALYARLRSPTQFLWLQLLSSGFLIILVPLTMTQFFYRMLVFLRLSTQSYAGYQKLCLRNVFIRFIAENASMAAFLGSIAVLHFGSNKDLYPYFAFNDPDEPYTFRLTYISSFVTWACELTAAIVVRLVIRYCFGVDVDLEGKMDLVVWPELLPTSAAVTLHVLQNMMFSIIRLQFKRG